MHANEHTIGSAVAVGSAATARGQRLMSGTQRGRGTIVVQQRYGGDKGNVQCATCNVRRAQEGERLDSMMAVQRRQEKICQMARLGEIVPRIVP